VTFDNKRVVVALVGLVVVLSIPFAVLGPKFILDDWFTLYWRTFDGVLWTGGHGQLRARPGAWLTFLVEFGLIGRHPLAIYALQTALNAAIVVAIFSAARRALDRTVAAAIAVVWVLLQDHSSLDHWASTMPSQVSLLLLLVGIVALFRSVEKGRTGAMATALFVASALSYEASLPLAAVALFVAPWLATKRVPWRLVALQLSALVATAAWMAAHTQHHEHGWFRFDLVFPAHFGWGITPGRTLGEALGLLVAPALAVAVAGAWLPSLRERIGREGRLVGAGLVIIILGTLAFGRDPIEPIALGDRANVVAAVGAAIAWVGLGLIVVRWRRSIGVALLLAFTAMSLVGRGWRDLDYARAGRDADRILAAVATRFPSPPRGVVVVGPGPVYHRGVVGLLGEIQEATGAYTGDNHYRVLVANNATEFDQVPPELRVDVAMLIGRGDTTREDGGTLPE
jgi:hypothetical protein